MPRWLAGATSVLVLSLAAASADAASLAVSPISIERTAPAAAATLSLTNSGNLPTAVQIRVFRWTQGTAGDALEPTRDVVVSPPIVRLKPNTDYTVRVIRVAKRPIIGEEAYRIFIDELPDKSAAAAPSTVQLLLRYSVPVFFREANVLPAAVAWSLTRNGGAFLVRAVNRGPSRLRVSQVSLTPPKGQPITLNGGLVGYVLGGSTMTWTFPSAASFAGAATLTFDSDKGRTDVPVVVKAGN